VDPVQKIEPCFASVVESAFAEPSKADLRHGQVTMEVGQNRQF
jgi:hypothetical protein